jgi:hypothetical protein
MIYIKQNDRRPVAQKDLTRGGVAVDLTLATGVTFKMRPFDKPDLKINAGCTINDAVTGDVEYRWQADDTDVPGKFHAEYEVIWNDGTTETFPTLGSEIVLITGDLDS